MNWTPLHAEVLNRAFERLLGQATRGSMAFVRCLLPEVNAHLAQAAEAFAPQGWQVYRVSAHQGRPRTITADQAVRLREDKEEAVLLLVDVRRAGAGMDGIYSAAREIREEELFRIAVEEAYRELRQRQQNKHALYAQEAVKRVRGVGSRRSLSHWDEFDFLIQVAHSKEHPGRLVARLGLWPIEPRPNRHPEEELRDSLLFVNRLLGKEGGNLSPRARIDSLQLEFKNDKQRQELERFIRAALGLGLREAVGLLEKQPALWVNCITIQQGEEVKQLELLPWRSSTGRLHRWSGLSEPAREDGLPLFHLDPAAESRQEYSTLEVRWRARPDGIPRAAATYRVEVLGENNQTIASQEVSHSGSGNYEKCRFSNEDFAELDEGDVIHAHVVVSVIENRQVEPVQTEEFEIRVGPVPPRRRPTGGGIQVRAMSLGAIELQRDQVTQAALEPRFIASDTKREAVVWNPGVPGKRYRVSCPKLLADIAQDFYGRNGAVGRWQVRVRGSGQRVETPKFVPLECPTDADKSHQEQWKRVVEASRRLSELVGNCGGVGLVLDQQAQRFSVVNEYLLSWASLLKTEHPPYALANTVEIVSLSGKTIGLVVLPFHPLRMAWHVAFDNLVLHARFEEGAEVKLIRQELGRLDGALFPAFLPGTEPERCFVFADTLGFHCAGMVWEDDEEPKAALAVMARALGQAAAVEVVPSVGGRSARVLGEEINKYLQCHSLAGHFSLQQLRIHALHPGEGVTITRALGHVFRQQARPSEPETLESEESSVGFVLELYPSRQQRGLAGQFILDTIQKRRRGAGHIQPEDRWLLHSRSLPSGVNQPFLRWARKDPLQLKQDRPQTPAHLAVAFDTFRSRVDVQEAPDSQPPPLFVYGLLAFYDRRFRAHPDPSWCNSVPVPQGGEKHPARDIHTNRLVALHEATSATVAAHLGKPGLPVLQTRISREKIDELLDLHRLCDWVITLDRNAGLEYFDSPCHLPEVYEKYIVDAVPERLDLGCLQLITSTANQSQAWMLLDQALQSLGLPASRRNAQFIAEQLKSLSGRLAIQLTGQKVPAPELLALALFRAACAAASEQESSPYALFSSGFLIAVEDIRQLLEPFQPLDEGEQVHEQGIPDLIHVSVAKRYGLQLRFISVRPRRHLHDARHPILLRTLREQLKSFSDDWEQWLHGPPESIRSVRLARLIRVLWFYAQRALRHAPSDDSRRGSIEAVLHELHRVAQRGNQYRFHPPADQLQVWVFCPECASVAPVDIAPEDSEVQLRLFGPALLPDHPWEPHTSVQEETRSTENAHSSSQGPNPPAAQKRHTTDSAFLPPNSSQASEQQIPELVLGWDLQRDSDTRWELSVRGNPHLLIAGLPGMGKTTCLINLCRQMVQHGIRPIVFSYHHDIDDQLQRLRLDFHLVDIGPLRFHPLEVRDRQKRFAYLDVAGTIRDIFQAIFPELGDLQTERIREAVKQSFEEQGWGDDSADPAVLREPDFGRFVEILRSDPRPDRSLKTLLQRMGELMDYGLFKLAEDQQNLLEVQRPVLVPVHSTRSERLQRAFATLVFYWIYKDMFRRGPRQRIEHAIIFDEAHRASRLTLIPTMAKECRKFGISLILASQQARDFQPDVFSAIANYLVLRLAEPDARMLVRNVATSSQAQLLTDRIKQMDRFHALYFSEQHKRPRWIRLANPGTIPEQSDG